MKILENRLKNIMNFNQPIEQVGFRSGFSTYQLIEKSREYQIDIFLAFFDNRKAFDTIEQSYIFKSMLSQGINPNYISLIQEIYTNSEAKIILEENGLYFPINRGVKQGDPWSPALINCALEDIFKKLNWTNKDIKINGAYLNNLRFADDLVLIATSKGNDNAN